MEEFCVGEEVARPEQNTVLDFLNELNLRGYHDLCNYQCPPSKIEPSDKSPINLFEILDRTSGSELHNEFIRCFSEGL